MSAAAEAVVAVLVAAALAHPHFLSFPVCSPFVVAVALDWDSVAVG